MGWLPHPCGVSMATNQASGYYFLEEPFQRGQRYKFFLVGARRGGGGR